IKASIEIWEFFKRHTSDLPNSVVNFKGLKNDLVKISPNPVNDKLQLNFQESKSDKTVTIYSYTGELIYNERIAPALSSTSVDLSLINSGLYFVVVTSSESKNVFKIIKN
ncbi:MAG: T9SS type A sorting domain-containing protein, partial [Bacteroidota bacterium]|nr:T9SS type A sorting domain-containing protein [Bacteroidota bacterium]